MSGTVSATVGEENDDEIPLHVEDRVCRRGGRGLPTGRCVRIHRDVERLRVHVTAGIVRGRFVELGVGFDIAHFQRYGFRFGYRSGARPVIQ